MLAYRHQFHAGNFADVFKHILLVRLLLALGRKDKPYFYLDTHAGTGRYDLTHPWAQKLDEFRDGIERVWERAPVPDPVKPYLEAVRAQNAGDELRFYPGSPALARRFARPGDRIVLTELNRLATFSACVLEDGRIRLHASVSVTENNLPFAKELAIHAMSLQAADALPVARWLSERLGAEEDVSEHPVNGLRTAPDEMLGVALLYKRKRQESVWTPPIDFISVATSSNRCWLAATAGTHSFTAELPFMPDDIGRPGEEHPRARFQTWTDKPSPLFGIGALMLLRVPGEFDARTANFLNVAETVSPDCHQLGAWCHRADWGLAFVTFLPALVFQRGGPYATNLFESLVWHSASRALWAHSLLTE